MPILRACLVAVAILVSVGQARTSDAARLDYTVTAAKPGDERFQVSVHVTGVESPTADLAMPVWVPGVYQVQNYARAVRRIEAVDDSGTTLAVETPSESTWRVASGGAPFTVRYELDVSGGQKLFTKSQIDERMGVLQAGTSLPYLPAHRDARVSLRLDVPEGWRVATALDGGPRDFVAADYDELVDSPVLFGDFARLDFTLREIPFSVVVDKRLKFDVMKLGSFTAKLAGAQLEMFGSAPFRRYLFLYMVTDDTTGRGDNSGFLGLEHDESTLITIHPRLAASEEHSARWLAEVSSHELFHAWNVRAIKPEQLARPDYLEPPRVRSLWLLEGATSYYAKRFVAATLFSPEPGKEWFFGEMASSLATLESRESLEELSLEVPKGGLDSFRRIYPRGEATAFLLDLQMRADSEGRVGLDDVLRRLYALSRDGRGYREEDLPGIVAEVSGRDYSDFFRRFIAGREKPPIAAILDRAGWKLATRAVGSNKVVKSIREVENATEVQQQVRDAVLGRARAAAATASPAR